MLTTTRRRNRRPALAAALAVAVLLAAPRLPAQEEDEPEEKADGNANVPQFMVADENFDQWVFGNAQNAARARAQFNAQLEVRLADLDRTCKLTDAQKDRLRLAGRGDWARYMTRVDDTRRRFQLVKNDQNKFQAFFQQIPPLQQSMQNGLLADDSLFARAARTVLDPAQAAAREESLAERRRARYLARSHLAVATIDDSVGLTADQRRQLDEIVATRTKPPAKPGPQDVQYVLYELSRLPRETLKPLFTEDQWPQVVKKLDEGRAMEGFLRQNGVLPRDAPAASGDTDKEPTP